MSPHASLLAHTPSVVLGVSAGIAAYKAALVLRQLTGRGADVEVIPTPASEHFVGAATWEALSGHPVRTGVFDAHGGVDHVEVARRAQLIVVAPATADLLAKVRAGIADDLLTTTILASSCPVLFAPSMHTAMWQAAATQDNVATLKARGFHFVEPVSGALSSGDQGVGRMADPEVIAQTAWQLLDATAPSPGSAPGATVPREHPATATAAETAPKEAPLRGVTALVTAGGTREALDPVRYLGNLSSGRQGCEIARALAANGAKVTLVAANVEAPLLPMNVEVIPVVSAQEMFDAVMGRLDDTDLVACVAAVADYRPAKVNQTKIKKSDEGGALTLELVENPDILATVVRTKPQLLSLGFAAETGGPQADFLTLGQHKARRKGATFLAVNQVGGGRGFGEVPNQVQVLDARGNAVANFRGSKAQVAGQLVDLLARRWQDSHR